MYATETDGILADLRTWPWVYWAGVGLSIGIAAVNFFVGYTRGEVPLLAVGISFLVGFALFFTRF